MKISACVIIKISALHTYKGKATQYNGKATQYRDSIRYCNIRMKCSMEIKMFNIFVNKFTNPINFEELIFRQKRSVLIIALFHYSTTQNNDRPSWKNYQSNAGRLKVNPAELSTSRSDRKKSAQQTKLINTFNRCHAAHKQPALRQRTILNSLV